MKRILALLLVLAMCLGLMAACASKDAADDAETPSDTETTDNTQTPEDADTSDGEETTDDSEGYAEEDIVEINISLIEFGTISDWQPIEDAVNAITEQEIGVHVNLQFLNVGEYGNKTSLAITGGDVLDICLMTVDPVTSFSTLYANGQLLDIAPYLEEYGQDLVALMGDYLNVFKVDGGIYGIPTYKQYNMDDYLVMNQDLLDELGLTETAKNMKTWDDLTALWDQIMANTENMYMIAGQQKVLYDRGSIFDTTNLSATQYDQLGDSLYLVYVDEDGKVQNFYENEDFEAELAMVAEWYEDGYVWPDTATNLETIASRMAADSIFCQQTVSEYGVEANQTSQIQHQALCLKLDTGVISSSAVSKWACCVPVTAEEPEAAVKFLNLLYTDAELANLMVWGIENENYVVEDGVAKYPEGQDRDTTTYHWSEWYFGNGFLTLPWDGYPADFREKALENMNEAPVSQYMGFSINTSELSGLVASLTQVMNEYGPAVKSGQYTPELYDEFQEKLKTAGIDEYVAEVQAQLDAWVAENA